jgi:hypothetical protein
MRIFEGGPLKINILGDRAQDPPWITHDKEIVKAGISLIGEDVRGTIRATISPKNASLQITFGSTNTARATVVEEGRVDGTDSTTVTLRITGVAATPTDKPKADAQVQRFSLARRQVRRFLYWSSFPQLKTTNSAKRH